MSKFFREACRIVDAAIASKGEPVSVEDRNKRVMAAEHNLRNGVTANRIDTRSRLTTIRIEVPKESA
jgi:hypothetical protein